MSTIRNKGRVLVELSELDHAVLLHAVGYAAGAAVSGHQSRIHDLFVELMTKISDLPQGPLAIPDDDDDEASGCYPKAGE